LRRRFGWLFSDTVTDQFLRERNARLTIQESGSKSFFVMKVTPETTIVTNQFKLRFRIKLLDHQSIHVSVYNRTTRQMLVNVTAPFDLTAGSMKLDLGEIHLKMDIDDDPSAQAAR
jgi:hypothetical protein